jgi:hypothetical protein
MPALPFTELVTPTLLRRFELEAGLEDGDEHKYCGVLLREDGDLLVHHPLSAPLDSTQLLWASRILKLLNRELHHDGAWVVVFTHPAKVSFETVLHATPRSAYYMRYGLIFVDRDGDPQFTLDWLHGDNADLADFTAVVLAGIESTAQKCEHAWQMADLANQVLERKEGQTYKRARGETAPSAT